MKKLFERVGEAAFRLNRKVPLKVYATQALFNAMDEEVFLQLRNVSELPGIWGPAMAMPDAHWGYGFPIGGVAAFDARSGVISPGGIGYDVNCGVRLLRTGLTLDEVEPVKELLTNVLFDAVPSGVGKGGRIRLNRKTMKKVLRDGARWAVSAGYGEPRDLEAIEDGGVMPFAVGDDFSDKAFERARDQLGTLGSGNHFLEIQLVESVFDKATAEAWGLFEGQVTVMFHCGSRGYGHQVTTEWIRRLEKLAARERLYLPDRQLVYTYFDTPAGREYFSAMSGAANFGFANRQVITHFVREAFERVFKKGWDALGLHVVYDVSHNIAKLEEFEMKAGETKRLIVHRKGATRALPAGHPLLPRRYERTGQPVLLPGAMGRPSYVLRGIEGARDTFFTVAHGAGRLMSRRKAIKSLDYGGVLEELSGKGVYVTAASRRGLLEEAPEAYKDVDEVVKTLELAGLALPVVKLRTVSVMKG